VPPLCLLFSPVNSFNDRTIVLFAQRLDSTLIREGNFPVFPLFSSESFPSFCVDPSRSFLCFPLQTPPPHFDVTWRACGLSPWLLVIVALPFFFPRDTLLFPGIAIKNICPPPHFGQLLLPAFTEGFADVFVLFFLPSRDAVDGAPPFSFAERLRSFDFFHPELFQRALPRLLSFMPR